MHATLFILRLLGVGLVVLALLLWVLPALFTPAPEGPLPGTRVQSIERPVSVRNLEMLFDETAWDPAASNRVFSQEIFDRILTMIQQAEDFVVLDFFLWNAWQGALPETHREPAGELAEALIRRKTERPDLDILVLTDPINRIYGDHLPGFFRQMARAGIPVVFTDLDALRDPNPLYSLPVDFYAPLLSAIPAIDRRLDQPRHANPFQLDGPPISTRQLLTLLHFKANHRKVVISDAGGGADWQVLVTSLNPADGSSAHSNIGLMARGAPARIALESELRIARWSARDPANRLESSEGLVQSTSYRLVSRLQNVRPPPPREPVVDMQWLTEGAIYERLLRAFAESGADDHIRIALFYLSDHAVIDALLEAARRGARIDIILDANRDAFGRRKIGIPNRPVAARLMRRARAEKLDLQVRWAETHGEQFHTKAASWTGPERALWMGGSANWTRRNLRNFNLEANACLSGHPAAVEDFNRHFDRWWTNASGADGLRYTVPYEAFAEKGVRIWAKTLLYHIQERTGLSTF